MQNWSKKEISREIFRIVYLDQELALRTSIDFRDARMRSFHYVSH